MRPAQLTPENKGWYEPAEQAFLTFNEAGAINAGKPEKQKTELLDRINLQ